MRWRKELLTRVGADDRAAPAGFRQLGRGGAAAFWSRAAHSTSSAKLPPQDELEHDEMMRALKDLQAKLDLLAQRAAGEPDGPL